MNTTQVLPSKNEYQQALQNPGIYLVDPRLKRCIVEKDPFGMPRVRSGGFALTYQLSNGNQKWALRCFHKFVPGRAQRYKVIADYLSRFQPRHFINVEFIPQGIKINGDIFPVTLMDWVSGDTLGTYIYNNYSNRNLIGSLITQFADLAYEINSLEIAHGDLSNANIIISNGKMILVVSHPEMDG